VGADAATKLNEQMIQAALDMQMVSGRGVQGMALEALRARYARQTCGAQRVQGLHGAGGYHPAAGEQQGERLRGR
jgi:hypothetical protein